MNYEFNIKAIRKDFDIEILVRKMEKDEMPKNGITYYCQESGPIYNEHELEFFSGNSITSK